MRLRFLGIGAVLLHALCFSAIAGLVLSGDSFAQDRALTDADIEFFESRIRPVLVEHCYECHNSGESAEAGLSLDHRAAIRQGSDSGAIIAADGQPSLLLKVLRHEIPGLEMPEGGSKLASQAIRDFEKWVEMGAPDPRDNPPSEEELSRATAWRTVLEKRKKWWSFQPVQVADTLKRQSDASSVIDQMVASNLAERGLVRSQRASESHLVRRLSFALTGLPPKPEEVREFSNDPSHEAYAQLVDKYLDSPQFGERWARHWMDWIRYAESHGSEGDPRLVGAEQYRDYLIRALNDDIPYDQLVREHIAGDLLAEPRLNRELGWNESLIGTAHWRMVFHGFSPTDALDEKVRFTDDALNVFGKTFLGLTISCARCHNHKFDPISQADYYAIFGVLASTRPGRAPIEIESQRVAPLPALAELKRRIRDELAAQWLTVCADKDGWGGTLSDHARLTAFLTNSAIESSAQKGAPGFQKVWQEAKQAYSRFREQQQAFEQQDALNRWSFREPQDYAAWYRYGDGLRDDSPGQPGDFSVTREGKTVVTEILPGGAITNLLSDRLGARFESPSFRLNGKLKVWLHVAGRGQSSARYVVQDYPRNGTIFPVTNLETSWKWQAYELDYWDGDSLHLELSTAMDAPLLVKSQERSWFGIRQVIVVPQGGVSPPPKDLSYLEELFESDLSSWQELSEEIQALTIKAVSSWQAGRVSDAQAQWLSMCMKVLSLPSEYQAGSPLQETVHRYRELEQAIPTAQRVPTISEWSGSDSPLLIRGDHRKPAQPVPRRFLEAIDDTPYKTELSGRAELAESVLSENNPLTARVVVNRLWLHLMGQGIVGTPDNFGRLGESPTHPDLIDYLAWRIRHQDDWSLKSMIRHIVLSETFCQTSSANEASQEVDPTNRMLSHYPVRRLEAEAIRDAMLSTAGSLDLTQFGAAVPGESNRRSVYVRVIRNRLDPLLTAFDAPIPFSTKGKRDATNVPAQSLMLMNSPLVKRWSKAFADQAQAMEKDEVGRLQWMWWTALGRESSKTELDQAQRFLEQLRAEYATLRTRREQIETQQQAVAQQKSDFLDVVRDELDGGDPAMKETKQIEILSPIAEWAFDDVGDELGDMGLTLHGSARLEQGALVLDGSGYASTASSLPVSLSEKTLEVVVELNGLDQRGGGAMTIQSRDGVLFDSIVYGEQRSRFWISGSNNFRRTQDFRGMSEVQSEPTHFSIAYEGDGSIRAYRNGELYGASYKTDIQPFASENASVLFGLRHGTSVVGGRMLRGRILHARLYDRALTNDEVRVAAQSIADYRSMNWLRSRMSDEQKRVLQEMEVKEKRLSDELAQLSRPAPQGQEWTDLAHMIFNSKEFIYVR